MESAQPSQTERPCDGNIQSEDLYTRGIDLWTWQTAQRWHWLVRIPICCPHCYRLVHYTAKRPLQRETRQGPRRGWQRHDNGNSDNYKSERDRYRYQFSPYRNDKLLGTSWWRLLAEDLFFVNNPENINIKSTEYRCECNHKRFLSLYRYIYSKSIIYYTISTAFDSSDRLPFVESSS
jgi:hypothetical protein